MKPQQSAEVHRVALEGLVLQIKVLGLDRKASMFRVDEDSGKTMMVAANTKAGDGGDGGDGAGESSYGGASAWRFLQRSVEAPAKASVDQVHVYAHARTRTPCRAHARKSEGSREGKEERRERRGSGDKMGPANTCR